VSAHPVESLSAFLDEELAPAERRDVATHLAACASCARHLQELAAVDALARDLPPVDAPAGYLEALPGRVRQRIRADRPASVRAPWVWPLAAGIALAVLAPLVLRQQRPLERPLPERAPLAREEAAAPVTTAGPAPRPAASDAPAVAPQKSLARRRQAAPAAPPPPATAPAAPAQDAFAPPPAAYATSEQDRRAPRANAAEARVTAGTTADAAAEPELELKTARDEGRADAPDTAAGRIGAASSLEKAKDEAVRQRAGEEQAFQEAASVPAASVDEARRARDAWRRFVAGHPAGPRADEGRVRFVEAAVAVFRLTRDERDRAIAEREGRAYLKSPGAPQTARVEAALRRLDAPR
jgi:hypothetical protein